MKYIIVAIVLALSMHASADRRSNGPLDPPVDRREKIKQKIRALRAYTLTESLALDEKTAGKLFPILAKWDDVTDKLMVQRIDLQRQLESADGKDPRAIDKLIDESMANQRALTDLEDKRLAELRKILTPAQTAKLLVVLPQFERRIRNQLARAIQNRAGGRLRGGRGRGGELGGNPFDRRGGSEDEDDDVDDLPGPSTRLPERTTPTRDTPRAPDRAQKTPCDPFSSVHGCK